MSASMVFNLCGRFRLTNMYQNSITLFRKCANVKHKAYSYSTLLTVVAASKNESDSEKLQTPDPSMLTHEYLIRNAASQTIDCVSTVITQTALAIIETEKIYKETVDLLTELLEYQLTILGLETEENQQRVWDVILAARAKLSTAKHKRQELALLMASVERMVHDAGEVAFVAGAEYSATCSAERLQSALTQIGQVRGPSAAAEKILQDLEIKVIEKTAKQEVQQSNKDTDNIDTDNIDTDTETENGSEDKNPESETKNHVTSEYADANVSSEEYLIT